MRSSTPWLRRRPERLVAVAVLAASTFIAACVTSGTHDAVRNERDALRAERDALASKAEMLDRSKESLEAERIRLIDENEGLVEAKTGLEENVSSLSEDRSELTASLVATQQELAARTEEVSALRGTYDGLVSELEAEVASGQIQIEQLRGGLRLNVSDEILFASGSAVLGDGGAGVIRKVASQLLDIEQRVEVQGHSDDQPVSSRLARRYPSNWELAGARAASVVRVLQEQGVGGDRLTAVSYGPFRPVAPNASAEERALNRRIEIRLLPPEPAPAPVAGP